MHSFTLDMYLMLTLASPKNPLMYLPTTTHAESNLSLAMSATNTLGVIRVEFGIQSR